MPNEFKDYQWRDGYPSDTETTLKMVPMCSCGYLLKDLKVVNLESPIVLDYNERVMLMKELEFVPSKCPRCGRIIKEVV